MQNITSIRLRPDQIARLPKGQGAKIIRLAIQRYHDGEIVIPKTKGTENDKKVLQVFALRGRLPLRDARKVRQILDAHLEHPVDHSADFERWDAICREMLDLDSDGKLFRCNFLDKINFRAQRSGFPSKRVMPTR